MKYFFSVDEVLLWWWWCLNYPAIHR